MARFGFNLNGVGGRGRRGGEKSEKSKVGRKRKAGKEGKNRPFLQKKGGIIKKKVTTQPAQRDRGKGENRP